MSGWFQVSEEPGDYLSDAAAGDVVLRTDNSNQVLRVGCGLNSESVAQFTKDGLSVTSLETDSFVAASTVLGSITASNVTSSNTTASNAAFSNAAVGTLTSSNVTLRDVTASNVTFSNLTLSNLSSSNSIVTTASLSNLWGSNATFSNLTSSNALSTSVTLSNLWGSNATVSNFTSSNAVLTSVTLSNLTGSNATVSNFTASNSLLTSVTLSNLTGSNATVSNLTVSGGVSASNATASNIVLQSDTRVSTSSDPSASNYAQLSIGTLGNTANGRVCILKAGVSLSNFGYITAVNPGLNKAPVVLQPNGGSVGVGVSSPTEVLDVVGCVKSSLGLKVGSVTVADSSGNIDAARIASGTVDTARLPSGSTSGSGIVQLTDSVSSTSTTTAATAASVKQAYDLAAAASNSSGGSLPSASTSNAGIVQLTDSVSSTSTTTAATPNSVKQAYDLANGKLSASGGTLTGDLVVTGFVQPKGSLRVGDYNPAQYGNHSNVPMVFVGAMGSSNAVFTADVFGKTGLTMGLDQRDSAFKIQTGVGRAGGVFDSNVNLTITSAGRMGIGTSNPSSPLTVASGGIEMVGAHTGSYNNNSITFNRAISGAVSNGDHFIGRSGSGDFSNDLIIHAPNQANCGITFMSPGAISRMRIDTNAGRVGIGTTAPSEALDVSGFVRASSGLKVGSTTVVDSSGNIDAGRLASGTLATARLPSGSTSAAGILQLTDSTSSTSTSTAATPNAVKQAYDLAAANLSASGGTVSGTLGVTGLLSASGAVKIPGATSIDAQGLHLQWNKDSTNGRSYIINQKGGGLGGFVFAESDTSNTLTTRMFIDESGRTGLGGLSNPSEALDVTGFVRASSGLKVGSVTVADASGNLDAARIASGTLDTARLPSALASTGGLDVRAFPTGSLMLGGFRQVWSDYAWLFQYPTGNVTNTSTLTQEAMLKLGHGDVSGLSLSMTGGAIVGGGVSLSNTTKGNGNVLRFDNATDSFQIQQIDDSSQNYLRMGRSGNGDIVVKGANGYVGINTGNPQANLEVNGTVAASGSLYMGSGASIFVNGNSISDSSGRLTSFGDLNARGSVYGLASNLETGANVWLTVGKETNTNNTANFRYTYSSNGSGSNYVGIGFWGNDDILNVTASGRVGIGSTNFNHKLHVVDQTNAVFQVDEYHNDDGAVVRGRRAKGTLANPVSVKTNDVLTGLRGFGYTTASNFSARAAGIDFIAAQEYAAGSNGSHITFQTTRSDTSTCLERVRITDAGYLGIGTTTPSEALDVTGFVQATSGFKIPTQGSFATIKGGNDTASLGYGDGANLILGSWFGIGFCNMCPPDAGNGFKEGLSHVFDCRQGNISIQGGLTAQRDITLTGTKANLNWLGGSIRFQQTVSGAASNDQFFIGRPGSSVANSVNSNDLIIHAANETGGVNNVGINFMSTNGRSHMRIDTVNDRVGVGVFSPSEKLDVTGFVRASSGLKVGSVTVVDSSGNIDASRISGSVSATDSTKLPLTGGTITTGQLFLGSTGLTNGNELNFSNGSIRYHLQQIDNGGANWFRIGRYASNDIVISETGSVTTSGNLTVSSNLTVTGDAAMGNLFVGGNGLSATTSGFGGAISFNNTGGIGGVDYFNIWQNNGTEGHVFWKIDDNTKTPLLRIKKSASLEVYNTATFSSNITLGGSIAINGNTISDSNGRLTSFGLMNVQSNMTVSSNVAAASFSIGSDAVITSDYIRSPNGHLIGNVWNNESDTFWFRTLSVPRDVGSWTNLATLTKDVGLGVTGFVTASSGLKVGSVTAYTNASNYPMMFIGASSTQNAVITADILTKTGLTMGLDQSDSAFKIQTGPTRATGIFDAPNLTISSAGKVGIGTTDPGYPLDVSGIARATSFYLPLAVNQGADQPPPFIASGRDGTGLSSNNNLILGSWYGIGFSNTSSGGVRHSFNTRDGSYTCSGDITSSGNVGCTALYTSGGVYVNGVSVIDSSGSLDASKIGSGTVATARLPSASTSAAGVVQLYNNIDSTSTTLAATANAVKGAYDLAATKLNTSGGTVTGNLTVGSSSALLTVNGAGWGTGVSFNGTENRIVLDNALPRFMVHLVESSNFQVVHKNGTGEGAVRLHINSNGNVGIGKNNPGTALDVNGVIANNNSVFFGGAVHVNGNAISSSSGALTSFGNFTAQGNLDVSGNVIIRSSPALLDFLDIDGAKWRLETPGNRLSFRRDTNGSLDTVVMQLDRSGNLYLTGTLSANNATLSDRRLKSNIARIEDALDKVAALEGCTFDLNSGEETRRETGLIAQDVQAVLPEAVRCMHDDGMLSLTYGNLAGLFVEAIKELRSETLELRAENAELRAGLAELQAKVDAMQPCTC
jgi:hypothetical protein